MTGDALPDLDACDELIRAFVAREWDPELTIGGWWTRLAHARLAFPDWPTEWFGRSWDAPRLALRNRIFADAGVIREPPGLGSLMGAPLVIRHGTDDQRHRWLPPLADGTEGWSQLFSEPDAGSDLAGLTTRAERDGDEWRVTGQKVWTSGAEECDRGMLVARTDPDVPKHRGLTYFIIDMHQPGVEIRPMRQMNGESHFSEVFFDGARVADGDRLGALGDGWRLTTDTLAFERSGLSGEGPRGPKPTPSRRFGDLGDRCGERIRRSEQAEADRAMRLIDLPTLHRRAVADRPATDRVSSEHRRLLVEMYARDRLANLTMQRGGAGDPVAGHGSVAKLMWTQQLDAQCAAAVSILGAGSMLSDGHDDRLGPATLDLLLSFPAARIAGGTDEVQRNIVGERVLGLPREQRVDKDVPFKEVAGG